MSKLDKKLIEFLKNNKKVNITEQAIRNEISIIRRNNPGLTLNAAAKVFADKREVSVMRYLSEEDRKSISSLVVNPPQIIKDNTKKKIKTTNINPKYGKKFLAEANKNGSAYPYIYILENSLRDLLLDIFGKDTGWWNDNKIVPKKVKEYSDHVKEAEKKHDWLPARGKHPIFYVGLNELCKIIEKNYSQHFKNIFTDKGNLRTWVNECIPIRNKIAHNVKISNIEKQNLEIRTEYICTLIKNNYKK